MLDYKELEKIVPSKTYKFINKLLPYLDYYSQKDKSVRFRGIESGTSSDYSKNFYLMLYIASLDDNLAPLFGQFGYDRLRYKVDDYMINYSSSANYDLAEIYAKNADIIPDLEDSFNYENLSVLDILIKAAKLYYRNCSGTIFEGMFPKANSLSSFINLLENYNNEQKESNIQKEEQKLYKDLPMAVISYLETASKIRSILLDVDLKDKSAKMEINLIPVSLYLALYFYQDPVTDSDQISMQTIIQNYFKEKGLTLSNSLVGIINDRLSDTKSNVYVIKKYYQRYFRDGVFKSNPDLVINVPNIIKNLFNREFTGSFALEKIMAENNCYIEMFDNLDKDLKRNYEIMKKQMSLDYVKSFYDDLSKEVKDYIEFATKTYSLILKEMDEGKHNAEILTVDDDADTLALFIATYYFDGDVALFFKDYNITLENVLELCGLSFTKEDIEKEELDEKILINTFKRFVYEGVNRNTRREYITINSIAHNLCNREFNKSTIMEDIHYLLTKKDSLESDFLDQLNVHFAKKENIRKLELTQNFFQDLPVETIEYLEYVSNVHNILINKLSDLRIEDIKTLSLLLGLYKTKSVKEFFEYLGITKDKICSYFKISTSFPEDITDIDILANDYKEYVFNGNNEGKEKKDITVFSISQNIFNKNLNNSVLISKLLAKFNLCYEDFLDLESKYQEYTERMAVIRKEEEDKAFVEGYSNNTSIFLKDVLVIHNIILEKIKNGEINTTLVTNNDDIAELSIVIAALLNDCNSKKFFEKNNITIDNILETLNLKSETFNYLSSKPIDYKLISNYLKYLSRDKEGYKSNRSIDDIVKRIFEKSTNTSLTLENLIVLYEGDYDILKEEIETGKDYELSLSVGDRINLLSSSKVDDLNLDNIISILHFGNTLTIHSKYIYDEIPKMLINDSTEESVSTIKGLVSNIYEKEEPKPQSFWERMFSVEIEEKPKLKLNNDAVSKLKENIDTQISSLSKELVGYDSIRKYLEVYRKKNHSYYLVSLEMLKRIEKELSELDPNNEEDYDRFVELSTLLQIMRDKTNRFLTANQIAKQELLRINQTIANHFITINALETAKNDLIPLIGSEIAIGMGRNTENEALKLSQNLIGLFESLLTKNTDKALDNMELLRESHLPEEIYGALNSDITTYLKNVSESNRLTERVEKYDIDENSHGEFVLSFGNIKEPVKSNEDDNPTKQLIKK